MPAKEKTIQDLVDEFVSTEAIYKHLGYFPDAGDFFLFDEEKTCFRSLKTKELERKVYMFVLPQLRKNIFTSYVSDFLKQLAYRLPIQIDTLSTPYIGLKNNKVLNIDTLEITERNPAQLPFHYLSVSKEDIEQGEATRFKQFLNEVLVDSDGKSSPSLQALAQEMFGYALIPRLDAQSTFFLVGSGANGKSVFLEVLRQMIGPEFASALSIEAMTKDQFGTYSLIGKKINLVFEEESKYIRSDKFKALVAGDMITVRKIFGGHFQWKPTVKHIFATNAMPTFDGFDYALLRRMKFLPFLYQIPATQRNAFLTQELLGEMGGIVRWAIEGAKRIRQQNFRFSEDAGANKLLEKFKEHVSSAVLFFNETYIIGEGDTFMAAKVMYLDYCAWTKEKGKKQQSYYSFVRDIEEGCVKKIQPGSLPGFPVKQRTIVTF